MARLCRICHWRSLAARRGYGDSFVSLEFNAGANGKQCAQTHRMLSIPLSFFGRQQLRDSAINEIRPGLNRTGNDAYKDAVDNGLAALRKTFATASQAQVFVFLENLLSPKPPGELLKSMAI